ncbi:MAG: alpha/beta fold hydrolase [Candidatus Competibacteraceae bacterium]
MPYSKALADHYRVFCWDARGHGGSLTQDSPNMARMARDLHQLITHYDLQQAVLLGHSMGALTVWEYIRRVRLRTTRRTLSD